MVLQGLDGVSKFQMSRKVEQIQCRNEQDIAVSKTSKKEKKT